MARPWACVRDDAGVNLITLENQEGFYRHVRVPRPSLQIACALLTVAAMMLVANLVSTASSLLSDPGAGFWTAYFAMSGARDTVATWLVTRAPLVLVPLGLVLVVWALVSHPWIRRRLHQSYLRDGWVAEQVLFGVEQVGGRRWVIVLLPGDGITAPELRSRIVRVHARLRSSDQERADQVRAALGRAARRGSRVADLLAPDVPSTVPAVLHRAHGAPLVVIPSAGDRVRVYPLRRIDRDQLIEQIAMQELTRLAEQARPRPRRPGPP